jgi:hypothetical protein
MRAFALVWWAATLLVWGTPGVADDDSYVLMTPTASSCPQFVAVNRARNLNEMVLASEVRGWIEGYLSGYVRHTGRDLFLRMQGSSGRSEYLAGLVTWVENWCQANPSRDIKEGAEALIAAMTR